MAFGAQRGQGSGLRSHSSEVAVRGWGPERLPGARVQPSGHTASRQTDAGRISNATARPAPAASGTPRGLWGVRPLGVLPTYLGAL